ETTPAMQDERWWHLEAQQEIDGLCIGRGERARSMLAIGEIEVKPQAWHNIGAGIRAPVIRVGATIGALNRHAIIDRGAGVQRCGNLGRTAEGGLSEVEPGRTQPALARFWVDMRRAWIGLREDKPAILNVWIEERKEPLNLGGVRLRCHSAMPSE